MDNTFYGSKKKRLYIKKWVESKKEYKNRNIIAEALQVIALIILVFSVGYSIRIKAFHEFGEPFTNIEQAKKVL